MLMPHRVRRSLLRGRAVRSLPLAPSSVPLIPSRQCAAFTEKSELTTGGSLPACPVPCFLITFSTRRSLLRAPRSDHVLNRPGLGIRSPLDCDEPAASR
jgi:hypothetical protein